MQFSYVGKDGKGKIYIADHCVKYNIFGSQYKKFIKFIIIIGSILKFLETHMYY